MFQGWINKGGIVLFLFAVIITLTIIFQGYNSATSNNSSPNVIIIIMDTVRQDHLSCYGYRRSTSPTLSQLVESSRIYYNAYSTSGWTSSAHASLFTGLFPITHKTSQENWTMSNDLTTLAEIFSAEGYETIGIVENPMLSKHYNFNQGFSTYYETWEQALKDKVIAKFTHENAAFTFFKRSLRKRNKDKPFFMFINFIEPHSPYDSSQQFYKQFLSNQTLQCNSNKWADYFIGKINFTHDELLHLGELYDAEILCVDYWLGKMIDKLKNMDLWDNTVFIVTSDHGENIGDHKMMDHVFSLYESTIKIPLIIHYPKLFLKNSKDNTLVQLTDIFPTILNIAGISTKRYFFQGQDLLEKNPQGNDTVFCEYYYPKQALEGFSEHERESMKLEKYKRRLRAVISSNMKFIWGSDGNHELYDLVKDPEEKENLIDNKAYITSKQEMIQILENLVSKYQQNGYNRTDQPVNKVIDKRTRDALKSLGYLH